MEGGILHVLKIELLACSPIKNKGKGKQVVLMESQWGEQLDSATLVELRVSSVISMDNGMCEIKLDLERGRIFGQFLRHAARSCFRRIDYSYNREKKAFTTDCANWQIVNEILNILFPDLSVLQRDPKPKPLTREELEQVKMKAEDRDANLFSTRKRRRTLRQK